MVPKSFCAGLPLSLSLAYFFSLSVYACVLPSFRGGFIGLPRSYLLKTCWWTHLLLYGHQTGYLRLKQSLSLATSLHQQEVLCSGFCPVHACCQCVLSSNLCFCADLSSVPPVTVKVCACAHGHTCSGHTLSTLRNHGLRHCFLFSFSALRKPVNKPV